METRSESGAWRGVAEAVPGRMGVTLWASASAASEKAGGVPPGRLYAGSFFTDLFLGENAASCRLSARSARWLIAAFALHQWRTAHMTTKDTKYTTQ